MSERPVRLHHALDFYLLEAMRLAPVRFGNRPQENIIKKINRLHARLAGIMAKSFYDYLFLACIGEARHFYNNKVSLLTVGYEGLPQAKHRSRAVMLGLELDPKDTLPKLKRVFGTGKWRSSFGGLRWAKIADIAMQYGEIPNPAFVDLVVDLSHNSGLVFNKPEALQEAHIAVNGYTVSRMSYKTFLSWKSEQDILRHHPPLRTPVLGGQDFLTVTNQVYYLLRPWYNLFNDGYMPPWFQQEATWPTEEVGIKEYGTQTLGPSYMNYYRASKDWLASNMEGDPINVTEQSIKQYPVDDQEMGVPQGEYPYLG